MQGHFALRGMSVTATIVVVCGGTTPHPNVLWILADDFGFNDIGYHNAANEAVIRTPHLDALAADGVKLENAYTQPICSPTRSQALSGRYQIHTGLQHGVIWPLQANGLPLNETTIADRLKMLGYETHAIGKWHVSLYTIGHVPTRRGFDSFLGFWGGGEDFFTHSYDFRSNETYTQPQYNGQYSTTVFSQHAVQLITANNRKTDEPVVPWFIYLAYQATHSPLQAPEEWIAKFNNTAHGKVAGDADRQTFAAMAGCMDEGIGNITAALRANPEVYANTVIFFSGDNGGQVHAGGNNWPLRGWKGSLWEGGARASSFIHSPLLNFARGTTYTGLVHIADWYPTTLVLAGGSPAQDLDGYDIFEAVLNSTTSPRTELLHEIDPIAYPVYTCSGPIGKHNATWDLPPRPGFTRAAITAIINGTQWKLLMGDCAGWDTNSSNIPPPGYTPDPTRSADASAIRGGSGLGAECSPTGSQAFSPGAPPQTTWLFRTRVDASERCDLSLSYPHVVIMLRARLVELQSGAVPCRYPNGDPDATKNGPHVGPWEED
eukprot:m.76267 g.76267  ORF g.76267 m.76267 type:complete len:547 (-) comp24880_c0_seq2:79-1719(-)